MKLLLVTWRDACSDDSGWKPLKKITAQKPMRVKSVGWLVKRTRTHLTLVGSIVADHCDGDVTIPLGMTLSKKELTVKG
jgi:hypothetical protein